MSVPAHKRSESKLQYKESFIKLYNTIFYYIAKDFGIKSIVRDLKAFTNNAKMTSEDAKAFSNLCNTYNIGVESNYPQYILNYFRNEILNTLGYILKEITLADTIFPYNEHEYFRKRDHQCNAIAGMEYIIQVFQRVIHLYPVNEEKYTNIVNFMVYEIELLRKWKKNSNKLYKSSIKKQIENTKEEPDIQINEVKLIETVGVPTRADIINGHEVIEPIEFISNI